MTQPIQTHINAYYDELTRAKQNLAVAQGEVEKLEDQIRGRGGIVPSDEVIAPEIPEAEIVATGEDVSASEAPKSNKFFKKGE